MTLRGMAVAWNALYERVIPVCCRRSRVWTPGELFVADRWAAALLA